MRRKNLLAALAVCLCGSIVSAGEIKLARHPDYANGKIVFSYQGDLWLAQEDGSNPQRLTVHSARDIHPRFSPDGKFIAFSSNRHGNHDVFVMPAEGGAAKQLTFHSAGDTVVGWTRDSKKVLFSSPRGLLFPGISNLYEVPVDGGLEQPVPTDWGVYGCYSPDGKKLAFNRHPAPWSRKHYRGSYCADLWVMDVDGKSFKRIVDDSLPDEMKPNNFWPMYGRDGFIYFVSDRDVMAKAGSGQVMTSTNNIWKVPEYGGQPVQVTRHKSGSLFFPSMSADGRVIVYEENFGLCKLDVATGESREIKIDIRTDDRDNPVEAVTSNGECDSYYLSPSGKRAVIATHGELFTVATDKGDVRRLTQTPGARDGQPAWSPDGKWIAFVSDRSGREEVWLCDEQGGQLKQVSEGDSTKGNIVWSPDSKALLYPASDKKLYKYVVGTGQTLVVASGEVVSFGGMAVVSPQWSPDGKWISFTRSGANLLPHIYIVAADGGKEHRITDEDTYTDSGALWTPDGKKIVFVSGLDISNLGQGGRSAAQIHVVSLTKEEKDPTDKSIDNEEQAATAEREQRRDTTRRFGRPGAEGSDNGEGAAPGPRTEKVEVKIDFEGISRRVRQLTRSGDTIGTMTIAPDSRSVVFTTSGTEGGRPVNSLWSMGLDGDRLTRVTQAGQPTPSEEDGPPARGGRRFGGFASLQFAKDGRTLFYRQGDGIYAVSVSTGAAPGGPTGGEAAGRSSESPTAATASRGGGAGATPRRVSFTARAEVDYRAQRKQVFHEAWRVMKHRFYEGDMHGVDWNRMKAVYEPLLEHAVSQEEMHDVVSMMIGELNASHTGISGGGRRGRTEGGGVTTRHPGFELEEADGFYRVKTVYKNGPADKDYVKIKVGDYVLAVEDNPLKAGDNYWKFYTTAPSAKLEFTVNSRPDRNGAWKTKVTPTSSFAVSNLQYDKWAADRRARVEQRSDGEIGYLHIRQMNDTSLRQFERDLAALSTKKALVIDQRFNPGGNIDQELLQILQQKQYQYTKVRDSVQVTRPLRGFFGPMVVLQNERSTSDAEVFPDGFRTLKLGKVIGVTTYGAVIGTGAFQLMDGSTIRTPSSGLWNVGGQNLENYGVPPDKDCYVDNTPEDFLKGRDAQLEKAVELLKVDLQSRKK